MDIKTELEDEESCISLADSSLKTSTQRNSSCAPREESSDKIRIIMKSEAIGDSHIDLHKPRAASKTSVDFSSALPIRSEISEASEGISVEVLDIKNEDMENAAAVIDERGIGEEENGNETNLLRSFSNGSFDPEFEEITIEEKNIKKEVNEYFIKTSAEVSNCGVENAKSSANNVKMTHKDGVKKRFDCGVCNYSSDRQYNLKSHSLMHSGKAPFQCNICEFKFVSNNRLMVHKSAVHADRAFKCDECDYSCKTAGYMGVHMRTHSGEKPFACDLCKYTGSTSSNVTAHKRIRHSEEKQFKCEQCDYTCITARFLMRHMAVHTGEKPFKCDQCNFKCNTSSSLKSHAVVRHTSVNILKCGECSYACKLERSLKRHMVIHSGKKSFECRSCEFKCFTSTGLKLHKSACHSDVNSTRGNGE